MTAINLNQVDTDSTDTSTISYGASGTLPDFSALNMAFDKFGEMLNNFFTFEIRQIHPQIPFYDTPQGAIFSGRKHKIVQIKRRILEYQAKYYF